jgi:hypothetical protein
MRAGGCVGASGKEVGVRVRVPIQVDDVRRNRALK